MSKNRTRFVNTGDTTTDTPVDAVADTSVDQEATTQEAITEQAPTEVQTPVVQEPTPQVQQVTEQVVEQAQAVDHGFDLKGFQASDILQALLTRVRATQNTGVIITVQGLFDYCHDMRPGAVLAPQEGARHQAALFRLIQSVLERSGKDFNIALTTLLRIIEEGRSVAFHDKYVMRFMEDMTLNYDDQQAFGRLLHLFKTMAPVQSRKEAARQINFTKVLEYGVSQEARYRVQTFFNV